MKYGAFYEGYLNTTPIRQYFASCVLAACTKPVSPVRLGESKLPANSAKARFRISTLQSHYAIPCHLI
jgi:hypothetical protein